MSFIPIKPVAPFVHVRVPIPTDFTIQKEKVIPTTNVVESVVDGKSETKTISLENLVINATPEVTILESERIAYICSFYAGMMYVKHPETGQRMTQKKDFCIPKIVQVVQDNQEGRYQEGQFLVLTHWTNMSDVVLDDEKKYMYLMIEEKFVSGVLEKQEDGEKIFQLYFDNTVEDTVENIEARVKEDEAREAQRKADIEAKAAFLNSPKRGTSNSALAGSRPATAPNSGIQFVVPKL